MYNSTFVSDWLSADSLLYTHFKNKFIRERATYGIHQMKHEKQILKRAIGNVKQLCIERQIDNKFLPKGNFGKIGGKGKNWETSHGTDLMGWKLRENSGDNTCRYYTNNNEDDVRATQEEKSKQKLAQNGIGSPSNKDS
jgi:hypothetical protein